MDKMNILAIGSHPDDIEIGCGGALINYADKGCRVFSLIMTKGAEGGDSDAREREQEDSRQIMGVEKIFWGGYRDTHLEVNMEVISTIESVLRDIQPAFIFCHYPEDTHQDHRHLAQATMSATRYIRNVLFYEGPTTQNFSPQVYVDITQTLDRKIQALEAHKSQVMRTNIQDLSIVEVARSSANFRGIQGRVKYAEAFVALRLFIDT